MSKIKKFRDYDDEELNESRSDRRGRLNEKRLRSALSTRNVEQLLDIEEDYI